MGKFDILYLFYQYICVDSIATNYLQREKNIKGRAQWNNLCDGVN